MPEPAILPDPLERFARTLAEAQNLGRDLVPEPTAFTLATVDERGHPAARILLLKGADDAGFVFYTNYQSRKGRELLATHRAAMCFHWPHLETQIRVEGPVATVASEEADAYFASRPRGSQIGAWASAQSRTLERYEDLEARVVALEQEYHGRPIPRPPYWSGFRLRPERMEFWKNMPSRLHRRELYTRDAGGWRLQLLYP